MRDKNKHKINEYKAKYYKDNKEEIDSKRKNYLSSNKEKISAYKKRYGAAHRDEKREYDKRYRLENKEALSVSRSEYVKNNKDKIKEYMSAYRKENRDILLEQRRCRHHANKDGEVFKSVSSARELLRRVLRATNKKKMKSTFELIGYTADELKSHIEMQFVPNMSWQNRSKWHIDHIIPVSHFIKQGVTDPAIINALSNLQPLWAYDNLSKSNKVAYLL